jgi:hypothetical protein
MAFLSALVLFNVVLYVGALQNLDMPLIKNIFPSSKFGSPNLSPFNMAFDVASFKDNMVMQRPMALEKNSLHLPAAAPRSKDNSFQCILINLSALIYFLELFFTLNETSIMHRSKNLQSEKLFVIIKGNILFFIKLLDLQIVFKF